MTIFSLEKNFIYFSGNQYRKNAIFLKIFDGVWLIEQVLQLLIVLRNIKSRNPSKELSKEHSIINLEVFDIVTSLSITEASDSLSRDEFRFIETCQRKCTH